MVSGDRGRAANHPGALPPNAACATCRCCQEARACRGWKQANEDAAAQGNVTDVDGDLCRFGVCQEGRLVSLNAQGKGMLLLLRAGCAVGAGDGRLRAACNWLNPEPPTHPWTYETGWNMSCPFPGDLFAQFPSLESLYLGWNSFTVSAFHFHPACCPMVLAGEGAVLSTWVLHTAALPMSHWPACCTGHPGTCWHFTCRLLPLCLCHVHAVQGTLMRWHAACQPCTLCRAHTLPL